MAITLNDIELLITVTWFNYVNCGIYLFDLELDQMTLVLKDDLNIVKIFVCTENKVPSFSSLKKSLLEIGSSKGKGQCQDHMKVK